MLRRNLYFAPASVKRKAYLACVLPIIEYGSTCWSPTSEKLNKSIEMIQHRAARFIANIHYKKNDKKYFSITDLLSKLNLDTIEERRTRARLAMAYKILNGHVILEPDMLPKFRHSKMRSCNSAPVGYQNQLIEPQATLHVTESTFFYSIPEIWNQRVTEQQAKSPSVSQSVSYPCLVVFYSLE